jgi:hypothetical protein
VKPRRDTENCLTRFSLMPASSQLEYQLAGCLKEGGEIRENLITNGLQRNKGRQSTLGKHLSMNTNLGNILCKHPEHKE